MATTTYVDYTAPTVNADWLNDVDALTYEGSQYLPHFPTGTGSIERTTKDKLNESISVKDFGAVGDGTTDDTAAFSAAITAADAAGAALYIPGSATAYVLTAKIAKTLTSALHIYGDGPAASVLNWTNADGGLYLTYTTQWLPPSINGLSFHTTAASGGTALKIIGPVLLSSSTMGPQVSNVIVRGSDLTTDYWDIGIEFDTCWYVQFDNITIKGLDDSTSPFDMAAGIKLTSVNVCFGTKFSMSHIEDAILQAGTAGPTSGEAFTFSHFDLVGVTTGINLPSPSGVNALVNISQGHINAYANGIILTGRQQGTVTGMLIYKTHLSSATWIGLYMTDCVWNRIHDCMFSAPSGSGGDTYGILLAGTGCYDNHIHDNTFAYFIGGNRIGILIGSGVSKNNIHDNNADDTVNSALIQLNLGAGTGNFIQKNKTDASDVCVLDNSAVSQRIYDNYPETHVYTPTLTSVSNVAASTAYACNFFRHGDIVTVSGKLDVDPTAGSTDTQIGISLPIASNFAAMQNCAGTGSSGGAVAATMYGSVSADVTNNRAEYRFTSEAGGGNYGHFFTFTYRII